MTENQTSTYTITLIDESGRQMSQAVAAALPRYIHIAPKGVAELSDSPEPSSELGLNVDSFDRVGSAVWVDDTRSALFVRRT